MMPNHIRILTDPGSNPQAGDGTFLVLQRELFWNFFFGIE
jgi:hypothetical protein